ncbi:MAG TPA: DNA primase [Verrucomicrobiota bacterium]|nr:DNA primase [Verrucomicrobiota bacterium]
MAGIFSQEFIERVRAASDIVDVIGTALPLKRAGANFVALCPFHKEKSPSFNVNPHRQIFHCFGCHKGGDVFTFVREYENVGFTDAVQRLAERAKIPIEYERGAPDAQVRHIKDQLLQIHEQIAQRWQAALANDAAGQIARDYLAKRGVSAEAIKLFRIGYAPDLWDDTVNWAKSKDHDLALIEKAGLVVKKEGADHYYDRFRGRLMFPICDEQARVIAFSGRVLSGDEKTAKYVNSPETPIFTKSKVFFGLDKSKRAVLDAGFAIVCEGQLDLIACFMAGVQNVVAPQGTAFTNEHARIIKRYVDEVVLCFDSDEAGQNAAVRSLDSLLASGLAVRVAVVPAPHDPDSFIKANGADTFRKLVEGAEGFFDYYLNRLCRLNDITTDKGRLAVLREMAEAVKKTGNGVLIDKYAQKTALRLGVTPDAVRSDFKKIPAAKSTAPLETESEEPSFEEAQPVTPSMQEFWLLKLVFLNEQTVPWLALHLDPAWIEHAVVREILERRLELHTHETWQNVAAFLDQFDSAAARSLITQASTEERPIPNPEQQAVDITTKLRNQFIDRRLAALSLQLNQPETSDDKKVELLRQQQQLRQQKRQPLALQ